jgi:hypothetical protein
MHADTDAIRAYGTATTELSADLRTAATLLAGDLGPAVAAALGPVGARFAEALADAAAGLLTNVTRIGDDVAAAGSATVAAARDYDNAELHARTKIALAGI